MTGAMRLECAYGLLARFASRSVGTDIAMIFLAVLWDVYRLPSNMAGN